jgi:hypothetical protein
VRKAPVLKNQKPDATAVATGFDVLWMLKMSQTHCLRNHILAAPKGASLLSGRFRLDYLATTVKTVGADVVTQMGFASGWLYCNAWRDQSIVRTVHTALGRGFFVLLNCHGGLLGSASTALAEGKVSEIGAAQQGLCHKREAFDYNPI